MTTITYHTQDVDDATIFYRAAGPADAPVILLLHGFPTASHMFRDLIPALAGSHRVIAPDLPGFGRTVTPPRGRYPYTFDALAQTIERFIEALGLDRYALYVFDYGAPVGYRLAMRHPERVSAIVTQNGNAYEEGFSADWEPWQAYWREPTPERREACRASIGDPAIRFQHSHGMPPEQVSPDDAALDLFHLRQGEREEIQLDLILDYRSNVALYPDFQAYFRAHQPPLLAAWGRHDAFFVPAGAIAYARDLPHAEIHLLDTGHFALATHHAEIAALIRDFLRRHR